jgi:hypothetical protein
MEAGTLIYLETLLGARGEKVLKEVFVVGKYVQETLLYQTISESTANFANLYCKGNAKCRFLTDLFDRPITYLEEIGRAPARNLCTRCRL